VPPEARPEIEICNYCEVRQNCDEYWNEFLAKSITQKMEKGYHDFQIKLDQKHGPTSWNGVVEISDCLPAGVPILVRTNSDNKVINEVLEKGKIFRLLNTFFSNSSSDEEASCYILTLTSISEAYSLS
tara:strand:- start:729 stop:1112 length:384 start_codon:yes stop_codon:yes gene_type:complete